ncbi:hypothetical protein EDC96DRAFT_550530 [Choanephora cucurbitarum]|nr:hypothetical protein EDC96DRAFT_550528 [Choanephora cucurbitarum]KAI8323156.1 hypothetical protein EDC96DRAFT_550530 [Choanephora cucurbitarum]
MYLRVMMDMDYKDAEVNGDNGYDNIDDNDDTEDHDNTDDYDNTDSNTFDDSNIDECDNTDECDNIDECDNTEGDENTDSILMKLITKLVLFVMEKRSYNCQITKTLERAALLSSSNIRVQSVRCLQVVDNPSLLQDCLFLPFYDVDALVFWCYRYMTESIAKGNGVLSLLGLYPDRDRWCSRLSKLSSAYDLCDSVCFWCSMLLVFSAMISLFSDSGVS